MNTRSSFMKKFTLVLMVLAIGLAAFPLSGASAESLQEPQNPPAQPAAKPDYTRLEAAWAREQVLYEREGKLLDAAAGFIAKVQTLIDKANQKGWDTSAVQAALDAFEVVIPAAQAAHAPGAVIIDEHAGFNPNGKVVHPEEALETVKDLRQVLRNTRLAMDGTGKALLQAIREFRQSHRNPAPATTPAP